MKINNEVLEIKEFIEAYIPKSVVGNGSFCVGRVSAEINEQFLMSRAEEVRNAYAQYEKIKSAFGRMEIICNETKQQCNQCPIKKYCNTYIRIARENVNEDSLKMIDLFCGAGGLSLGFTQEGFITSLANDIEYCCVDTYAHNHPETPRDYIVLGDIRGVVNNLDNLLRYDTVDIVIGGPPCQGFSMANRQRLIDDPRNQLYRSYVEVVDLVHPRFFVMENVKGMLSVANQVIEDFNNIGYSVTAKVLNAKDFGVPQNRERLIYIGNRIGVDNNRIFEEIEDFGLTIPDTVLEDALFGLRELSASRIKNSTNLNTEESGRRIEADRNTKINRYISMINQDRNCDVVCNHKARYNNDRDIEIFGRLNQGDRSDDPKIADIMPYTSRNNIFKDKYFKLENDKICKTITAHMKFDCNMYIHPTQARGLTPREAARVQSFPDDYFFRGAYTKTYMQIGNSVPPLLGRAIAHIVKGYLTE
ncbi:DNA cytosine methyltransferase [Clostridium botulinum]|uniref:DNA cytosine methyltransferase n=1 Tax=Clostridium botulinum TaxID=1491 RepID=UPI001375F46F|nr:DNA cytosine methyltransferase [Clostridium botulinum]MCC5417512.1 DNA cytosine methyltransferase [Clostridium botulinum]NCI18855.1 DNA cytosine methyltransferase [Clostridium botulinum]NCI34554.1 DNA cytosine methyltransferase [Clostridium botulinum]NCI71394.1 DNA cytosine methyltransferase [Clostridium botulinum]NDI37483.1 DNA cytosine methyltransferase [Clostridium botulinum]